LTVATDRLARVCQVTVGDDGSVVQITLRNTKDEERCAAVSCELAQLLVSGRGIRAIVVCSRRPSRVLVECMLLPFVEIVRKDARRWVVSPTGLMLLYYVYKYSVRTASFVRAGLTEHTRSDTSSLLGSTTQWLEVTIPGVNKLGIIREKTICNVGYT